MRKMTQKELRITQINILKAFREFCEFYNLKWWMDAGTLLGAVRHKGYIPWDDDIDVSMLRADYAQATRLFNSWAKDNNYEQYEMIAPDIGNNFDYPFGKIIDNSTILYEYAGGKKIEIGVYIDVFVFDNAPADKNEYCKMLRKKSILGKLRAVKLMGKGKMSLRRIRALIIKFLLLPVPMKVITMKIINNAQKYKSVETGKINDFVFPYDNYDHYLNSDFFDDMIMLLFEDDVYPAPANYDEWLRIVYGDYMKIPPKEEQIHHNVKAYFNN